ncbi:hypothetical protein OV079_26875 [Nannocystis pusilla]|uniref:Uncharacterized protein n=1 Tax=Nannocystis pusilla TaxID=889268 RepID=A0A9X3ERQ9_9BACT|nr:hypothetical protein [Nannocystis pusilla]
MPGVGSIVVVTGSVDVTGSVVDVVVVSVAPIDVTVLAGSVVGASLVLVALVVVSDCVVPVVAALVSLLVALPSIPDGEKHPEEARTTIRTCDRAKDIGRTLLDARRPAPGP